MDLDFDIIEETAARIPGIAGIVARERQERRRIQEISAIDDLTGLQSQNQWLASRRRIDDDPLISVLRIDIDGLKGINDRFGHQVGDLYIGKVAETIRAVAAKVGISIRCQFRTGGDEITVVGSQVLLEQIRYKATCQLDHVEIKPGLYGNGISSGIGPTEQQADLEMYRDKVSRKERQSCIE